MKTDKSARSEATFGKFDFIYFGTFKTKLIDTLVFPVKF